MAGTQLEKRDTIVVGGSSGGLEALLRLLPVVTGRGEASVLVVLHLPADGRSALDAVLSRATTYQTGFARDGEVILPRHVYIAPPDRHLVVEKDRLRLLRGPRENRSRPAIDPLFRSAAAERRGRVMGAVLSGLLDDGAAGLLHVKRCGGMAFVQEPGDALEAEMPSSAAEAVGDALDGALDAGALGARIASLIGTPAPHAQVPKDVELEIKMMLGEVAALEVLSSQSAPLPLSCPECSGPLWEVVDGRLQRFRCHTGHRFGVNSLLSEQGLQIESALWAAIKGLEQRGQVLRNLARDEVTRRRPLAANLFETEAKLIRQHAATLREVLVASSRGGSTESSGEG